MDKYLQHSISYKLGQFTRSNEFPSWEYIDAADLSIWQQAVNLLQSRKYIDKSCEAYLTADWKPALIDVEKDAEINRILQTRFSRGEDVSDLFSDSYDHNNEPTIEIKVDLSGDNQFLKQDWYRHFFAEKYIYDFFCVMNLANPGSCDFLNLSCISSERQFTSRLNLSSYSFEEALYEAIEEKSPYAKEIDINTVLTWFDGLGLGVNQVADSQIEKALFSMLNYCKTDPNPTSVVWIFHALESLYGTRVGEGFTNLVSRISLLLELDVNEQKSMKKNLRTLYDHRSSLIHGGYKVHHPMEYEQVDSKINELRSHNYKLLQFGFNLVLASIQTLIKNGWYGVNISEKLVGIESP